MSYAIRVENLGKRYELGATHAGSVRELVNRAWSRVIGRNDAPVTVASLDPEASERVEGNAFWALRDVSFEVKPGEVVGIIGRNGSGKSTLLKILSQITAPTTGRVELHGRVASLLEVGTGFHPELSGRENIYLNGAILGMSKLEIRRKFDEIVAFAEIEKFIDTPVKRYSSGMYVRLAFAVAAHLEPEILVVDEVLAVGDSRFQKKCLGKMKTVAEDGRSILFVSHNMPAVRNLCSTGIMLLNGRVAFAGPVHEVSDVYENDQVSLNTGRPLGQRTDREGSRRYFFSNFRAYGDGSQMLPILRSGDDVVFRLTCDSMSDSIDLDHVVASIGIKDANGRYELLVRSSFTGHELSLGNKRRVIECAVNDFPLAEGTYSVDLFLAYREHEILDFVIDAAQISVHAGDYFGTGNPGLPSHCKTLTRAKWACFPS